MDSKQDNRKNSIPLSKKRILLIAGALLLLVVIVGLFFAMQPQRTVANFCQVASEEKSILTGSVNYEKRVEAYKKLESVSPDTIQPDITAIRKGYESIVQSPSNTISAGLGIAGSENRRSDYIKTNCPNF